MIKKRKKIKDSKPTIATGAREVETNVSEGDQRIRVSLMLRFKVPEQRRHDHESHLHSFPHKHMDHDTYLSEFGADVGDIEKIKEFAIQHHLKVVHVDIAGRAVTLEGSIKDVATAFQVNLKHYEHHDHPGHRYHTHEEDISVSQEIHHLVTGVFGLNGQPLLKGHTVAVATGQKNEACDGVPAATFKINQLPKFYNFPTEATGKGQKVAIFAAGGGYRPKEMQHYFEKIVEVPMPKITDIEVGDGMNNPGSGNIHFDMEVSQDIQILGTIAYDADIAVYFTTNDEHGFLEALRKMVFDKERNNSVISISFGSSEQFIASHWSQALLEEVNNTLRAASLLGITVSIAGGDLGSCAGEKDGKPHAYFPASSPYVLACGGTMFQYKGGKILSEVTWKETISDPSSGQKIPMASAGGVSRLYPQPHYQQKTGITEKNVKGRMLPDVAGYASLLRGYEIYLDNQIYPGGATSGVSPLFAALFTLINQKLAAAGKQRTGFVNPLLYQFKEHHRKEIFTDIIEGNNDINGIGVYNAGVGWDCCTGWGIVNGTKLMEYLLEHQPAK